MIAQLVIAFYFIVCVGIILFNCFTEIISRYRSCVLKRPANKSQVEISGFGSSEKGNTKSSR